MSKNVAVFVDVANIFYAAKAAGVDIDYVTLLKASSAGRDLVRAYAYTGLDPENENQRNFHDFLRRHGYRVVSKDIRKYGDGKVKANLDIELVVDMMKTARNLDIAIVVSGDGDFAPAIRAVQEMGVRVEVVSFRGNTSSDLIDVADIFTDITQVAKVEKGSSRSGRRVADDDEDLSMTEVPDKMTEGTGDGRRRGRGGRSRSTETATGRRERGGRARQEEAPAAAASNGGSLVALPGEKLSRAGRAAAAAGRADDEETAAIAAAEVEGLAGDEDEDTAAIGSGPDSDAAEDAGRRRRRRRGGRGRGRGRGQGEGLASVDAAGGREPAAGDPTEDDELDELPQPTPRRAAFSFGSVWDSQLGVPGPTARGSEGGREPLAGDMPDDEELEEPAIPEYLLAERRQRDAARGGRGRGGRGRGGAYAAAMERERFGSRGAPSRYPEPAPRASSQGRPPRSGGGGRFDRPDRGEGRGDRYEPRGERFETRSSGGDPWSEVPPEIEAMLRAQMAAGRTSRPAPAGPASTGSGEADASAGSAMPTSASRTPRGTSRSGTRSRRAGTSSTTADEVNPIEAGDVTTPPAATATRRRPAARTSAAVAAEAKTAGPAASDVAPSSSATRRRSPRPKAAAGAADATPAAEAAADAAPKRRTRRKVEPAA